MDLVVAMAPFVDEVTMTKTFELIKPYLEVRRVYMLKSNLLNLSIFLVNAVSVGAFVYRPKSQACRRRHTVCWRRCVEERETSVDRLSWLIWKHSKSSFSRL